MLPSLRCWLIVTLLALLSLPAAAQRDQAQEQKIWQELQVIAPASVADFKAATAAMDQEKFDEAAKLFLPVLTKAPDFDVVYRRLGNTYMQIGKTSEGLALLETAVQKKASAANLGSLARALAFPPGPATATAANQNRAFDLAQQANRLESDEATLILVAQLALNLDRPIPFQEAVRTLRQKYSNLMQTHYFSAIQAAQESDWIAASNEIKEARRLGLAPEVATQFLNSGIGWRATMWRTAYGGAGVIAFWLVGLLLLFVVGKIMSAQVLRSVTAADPNSAASNAELQLRQRYRQLINLASIYYYISIPIVIFLVLAFAGGVVYFFLWLGRLPIKLVGFLVIGALITVFLTLKSFFTRLNREDPGRPLKREEAPALWKLVDDVAAQIGTRAVDEIRITPGTEMAVYENGSAAQIKQDRGTRILLLGLGTLNGFSQAAFRAVLAHEYGHFSHRDTAGGEIALQVESNMALQAQAMIVSEQATPWNIAFQFLRVYHFLFRRISHGATRLQEILADRVAARHFGPAAFQEGLTHVIRRSVEFDHLAGSEINAAVQAQRSLVNLYKLQVSTDEVNRLVEEQVQEVLQRATTEDDTHPAPQERFALVQNVRCINATPATGEVWDLFENPAQLTEEMSQSIGRDLNLPNAA